MSLLLDTQLVVWSGLAPERLGTATELIAQGDCVVSVATAWELAIKQGQGKLDLGATVRQFYRTALRELGATEVTVTADHASAVETLPMLHRDPFDRLLVAQAEQLGATLLTADRTLGAYGSFVQVI